MPSELDLTGVYEKLIRAALAELRKQIKDTGYLDTTSLRILPPLDTGGRVEVLFLTSEKVRPTAEVTDREPWTAWFEDQPEPVLPHLSTGW